MSKEWKTYQKLHVYLWDLHSGAGVSIKEIRKECPTLDASLSSFPSLSITLTTSFIRTPTEY